MILPKRDVYKRQEYLSVDGIEITLNEDIPAGHKFALKNFSEGENVIKYGYPIAVSYTHLAGLMWPYAIEQSKTQIANWLSNQPLMLDTACLLYTSRCV